jgi:hypothetical protein
VLALILQGWLLLSGCAGNIRDDPADNARDGFILPSELKATNPEAFDELLY